MAERIGKRKAHEHDFGRKYHDGTVRDRASLKVVPIRKRFWWPHPYARQAGLLWKTVTIGHRYYNSDGTEIVPHWARERQ